MKKILIINAHPSQKSFVTALADAYQRGAQQAGYEVQRIDVGNLHFNPNLAAGYEAITPLEPDLIKAQAAITWCTHLVITTPLWWMDFPAVMKGFLDRVLLPGFAFKYHRPRFGLIPQWDKLLRGRSGRIIYTQGEQQWLMRTYLADGVWRNWKHRVIGFAGFWPLRRTVFSAADVAPDVKKQKWLKQVYRLGKRGA